MYSVKKSVIRKDVYKYIYSDTDHKDKKESNDFQNYFYSKTAIFISKLLKYCKQKFYGALYIISQYAHKVETALRQSLFEILYKEWDY